DYTNDLPKMKVPLNYFINLIIRPLMLKILSLTLYRKNLKNLGKFDIIYVFNNYHSYLFGLSESIIGSNHIHLGHKLFLKLISFNILFPNIKAMHLFPHNLNYAKYLGRKKIISIPNGVDTNLFYPNVNYNQNKLRILFVARLEREKGVDMVLEVYKSLGLDSELYIVGNGTLKDKVDNFAKNNQSVHSLGIVSENELAEIYRNCDIFLYPTQSDQFPLVIMEALASGLKVITTKLLESVYNEFEQFNAIRFCSYNKEELISAIKEMSKVKIEKVALKSYIDKKYSWEQVSKKLFAAILQISQKTL
ncbi:MAG: glycosyltransferase family 4 protein, partial [Nitrososphaeria archaeon]